MVQLFSHWFSWNSVVRALLESVLLILSVVLAVAFISPSTLREAVVGFPILVVFALSVVTVNAALGLYQPSGIRTLSQTAARVVVSMLFAVFVGYVLFDRLPLRWAQHEVLEFAAVVAVVTHALMRAYSARTRDRSEAFTSRVLVLGAGAEASKVQESLCRRGSGCTVVGFYPASASEAISVPAEKVLDANQSLINAARTNRVDRIVVAVGDRRGGVLPLNQLLDCKLAGIKVLDFSSYFEQVFGQVRVDSLRASWLIFGEGFRQGTVRTSVKRAFDIVASLVLLLLGAPVMLITALLIAFESGFPILYRQERVGQGGRIFQVIKFRSMRNDAERDGKPRWATSNDNRVTRVGRTIRKLRIDELPQLFNVLKGDMSLVGPRPERPYFVEQLSEQVPFYGARHSIKPGVTGWAQVRYAYGASVEDSVQKLQYDLYYVKNHSLFLDLLIFVETVEVVLTGRGAQ
jgi:sugar transferase (PEP-CTERM system associated)